MALIVKDLKVQIEGKEIVRCIDLEINPGEVVALMGPNGSGKSTLGNALMGKYLVSSIKYQVALDGVDISKMKVDERARAGLFMAFQYPVGIPGVNVREVLLSAIRQRDKTISAIAIKNQVEEMASELGINDELLKRSLNDGFSGGEKKKMELLQLKVLAPKYAILDETDSGLDVDALKIVAKGAYEEAKQRQVGILVITHYQRLLKYLKPDRVLVIKNGLIVDEGGIGLVDELEKTGYEKYL